MNKFAQLAADITKLWTKYGTAYLSGIENTLILALVGTVIGCLIVCRLRAGASADKWVNPMADPFLRTVTMRRMTLAALAGWLAVVASNAAFFCLSDGLAAHDMTGFFYVVTYLAHYVRVLKMAAPPAGWMLFAIVVLVPIVLSAVHVGVATDNDKFLPYWHAAFFALTGLVAFLQLAGWR